MLKRSTGIIGLLICLTGGYGLKAQSQKWRSGIITDEFLYEKAAFPSCHSATIAETPTGLVAAYFGGTHSWGASPIYLLGKYYLGVKPLSAGYETYVVEPSLGGLEWMEGKVPTPSGEISLYCSKKEIRIKADEGSGVLRFKSVSKPVVKGGKVVEVGKRTYELKLMKGVQYTVNYQK